MKHTGKRDDDIRLRLFSLVSLTLNKFQQVTLSLFWPINLRSVSVVEKGDISIKTYTNQS